MGARMFVSPETENGLVGYSEPFRRFVQHEGISPQINEIQNDMPSWIPGEDHLINFQKGDAYIKLDEGYARLPGAGYEALHPELEGLDPEDYPDMAKLSILGDVAPYSREYNRVRAVVEKGTFGPGPPPPGDNINPRPRDPASPSPPASPALSAPVLPHPGAPSTT